MPTVAYRANRTRRKFIKFPEVKKQLAAEMNRKAKPPLIDEHEKRVENWEHQPDFEARNYIKIDSISITVFPAGENKKIWVFVSKGTKPHKIPKVPKTKGFLFFPWGGPGSYVPKTTTSGGYGGPGTVNNPEMTARRQVDHPGTEARNFEKHIREDFKDDYSRIMENAWRRIIRAL